MPRVINQIAGFLKMKLFGQSSGMDVPLAADSDGHLQIDIDSAKVMGLSGSDQKQIAVDADGHQQTDILSMPPLTIQFSTGTATPSEINPDDSPAAGSSSLAAKEDHVHGFPCAAPGTTTLGDSSAEGSALSAARSDHKHEYIIKGLADVRLTRSSATQLELDGLAGKSKLIEIDGEYVSLASAKSVSTSDNIIAADGTDSGSGPAANQILYAYVSNSQVTYAPSSLRLSATAPTNGYLASSGNGRNWRHVGWARTNTSTQFPANGHVVSRFNMMFDNIGNSITANEWFSNTQAANWEDIGVEENFLWPPSMPILVIFNVISYHGGAGQSNMARISLVQKGETSIEPYWTEPTANYRLVHTGFHYSRNGASLVYETIKVQGWTSQVDPNTSSFHKKNTSTNFVVLFLPEESAS